MKINARCADDVDNEQDCNTSIDLFVVKSRRDGKDRAPGINNGWRWGLLTGIYGSQE